MEKKSVTDEWWQHTLGSLKVNALGKTDLTDRSSWNLNQSENIQKEKILPSNFQKFEAARTSESSN